MAKIKYTAPSIAPRVQGGNTPARTALGLNFPGSRALAEAMMEENPHVFSGSGHGPVWVSRAAELIEEAFTKAAKAKRRMTQQELTAALKPLSKRDMEVLRINELFARTPNPTFDEAMQHVADVTPRYGEVWNGPGVKKPARANNADFDEEFGTDGDVTIGFVRDGDWVDQLVSDLSDYERSEIAFPEGTDNYYAFERIFGSPDNIPRGVVRDAFDDWFDGDVDEAVVRGEQISWLEVDAEDELKRAIDNYDPDAEGADDAFTAAISDIATFARREWGDWFGDEVKSALDEIDPKGGPASAPFYDLLRELNDEPVLHGEPGTDEMLDLMFGSTSEFPRPTRLRPSGGGAYDRAYTAVFGAWERTDYYERYINEEVVNYVENVEQVRVPGRIVARNTRTGESAEYETTYDDAGGTVNLGGDDLDGPDAFEQIRAWVDGSDEGYAADYADIVGLWTNARANMPAPPPEAPAPTGVLDSSAPRREAVYTNYTPADVRGGNPRDMVLYSTPVTPGGRDQGHTGLYGDIAGMNTVGHVRMNDLSIDGEEGVLINPHEFQSDNIQRYPDTGIADPALTRDTKPRLGTGPNLPIRENKQFFRAMAERLLRLLADESDPALVEKTKRNVTGMVVPNKHRVAGVWHKATDVVDAHPGYRAQWVFREGEDLPRLYTIDASDDPNTTPAEGIRGGRSEPVRRRSDGGLEFFHRSRNSSEDDLVTPLEPTTDESRWRDITRMLGLYRYTATQDYPRILAEHYPGPNALPNRINSDEFILPGWEPRPPMAKDKSYDIYDIGAAHMINTAKELGATIEERPHPDGPTHHPLVIVRPTQAFRDKVRRGLYAKYVLPFAAINAALLAADPDDAQAQELEWTPPRRGLWGNL